MNASRATRTVPRLPLARQTITQPAKSPPPSGKRPRGRRLSKGRR